MLRIAHIFGNLNMCAKNEKIFWSWPPASSLQTWLLGPDPPGGNFFKNPAGSVQKDQGTISRYVCWGTRDPSPAAPPPPPPGRCLSGRGRGGGGRWGLGPRAEMNHIHQELQKCTPLTQPTYTFVTTLKTRNQLIFLGPYIVPSPKRRRQQTGNMEECSLLSNCLSKINQSSTHLSWTHHVFLF